MQNERTEVFLVGEYYEDDTYGIVGVFSSRSLALAACLTTNHWFMPLILDTSLPPTRTVGVVGVDTFYPMSVATF